ncbi:fungal-specific transcription factor domain-containing protein [Stachybotrys elegans]|uniref:Fungal-specific transcription factor domain-containing protein n=1 Tax=Stachybotrys elegans TaxID=80388 RepID=A0A8K0SVG5_9HYPO|nr:fungal-specific transcription factor domain-containing protein [Stachybotrys elegans]
MKKSIACAECRSSKRKCIHAGSPPCDRCLQRGDECVFPRKYGSREPRRSIPSRPGAATVGSASDTRDSLVTAPSPLQASYASPPVDESPFPYFTDEVKACYVRCAYKWSFHHIPSLLVGLHENSLDVALCWAILALSVRFSPTPPNGYPTQIAASNAFASLARSLVLPKVDEPCLHTTQTLLLITGHSWGAGEGRRAWLFLGMAVRMAQAIGIFEEPAAATSSAEFIAAEERRRTAWTCFLMDSLLSGGKGRDRSLSAAHMHIQLPCDAESFAFGEAVRLPRLDGSISLANNDPVGAMSIIACTMQVADIWGEVAKWACQVHSEDPSPWNPNSKLQTLSSRLQKWKDDLPNRLRYDVSLLRAHTAANQGQAYCYMHSIYYLSIIFLYRPYLPEVEMEQPGERSPEWTSWSLWSRKELIKAAETVCEMMQEMRNMGLFFLRGLVPWVGFAVYTAVGTLLYFFHFPVLEEATNSTSWQSYIVEGCQFLKDMRQAWPMADTWRDTIQRMQVFYTTVKSRGDAAVTPTERRAIRHAIIDYGALQPSPVGEVETYADKETYATPENEVPEKPQQPSQLPLMMDLDFLDRSDDDELLGTGYNDAAQVFWESFPGTTGLW